MERVKLEVRSRDGRGRKDARALRAEGLIPGVIYTSKSGVEGSTSICVGVRDLRHAVSGSGGMYAVMDVMVDGGRKAHSVRDHILHIDFHEIRLDQPINTVVAVHLEGTPHGVELGGVLSQPVHELNISVLPTQIPEGLTVDVSKLEVGTSLRLVDVPALEGVTFLDDPESTVLASVTAPISEEELEPEVAEGEELPEGVEAPEEGEAAEGEGGEAPSEAPAAEE
jgi:large subunit ribosomal protein L25